MTAADFLFVLAVIAWALLFCVVAAGAIALIGAERIARALHLPRLDEDDR